MTEIKTKPRCPMCGHQAGWAWGGGKHGQGCPANPKKVSAKWKG